MGDEILKTNISYKILLALLCSSWLFADVAEDQIKEFDKYFTQISEKRVGIASSSIDTVKNPFLMLSAKEIAETNSTQIEKTYTLGAIFGKKAKINNEWYKLNGQVDDYKLILIKDKSVVIKNDISTKELFIRNNDVSKITISSN